MKRPRGDDHCHKTKQQNGVSGQHQVHDRIPPLDFELNFELNTQQSRHSNEENDSSAIQSNTHNVEDAKNPSHNNLQDHPILKNHDGLLVDELQNGGENVQDFEEFSSQDSRLKRIKTQNVKSTSFSSNYNCTTASTSTLVSNTTSSSCESSNASSICESSLSSSSSMLPLSPLSSSSTSFELAMPNLQEKFTPKTMLDSRPVDSVEVNSKIDLPNSVMSEKSSKYEFSSGIKLEEGVSGFKSQSENSDILSLNPSDLTDSLSSSNLSVANPGRSFTKSENSNLLISTSSSSTRPTLSNSSNLNLITSSPTSLSQNLNLEQNLSNLNSQDMSITCSSSSLSLQPHLSFETASTSQLQSQNVPKISAQFSLHLLSQNVVADPSCLNSNTSNNSNSTSDNENLTLQNSSQRLIQNLQKISNINKNNKKAIVNKMIGTTKCSPHKTQLNIGCSQAESLLDLSAKVVALYIPFQLVEERYERVPEPVQRRIIFWSFPRNENDIKMYSSLPPSSSSSSSNSTQIHSTLSSVDHYYPSNHHHYAPSSSHVSGNNQSFNNATNHNSNHNLNPNPPQQQGNSNSHSLNHANAQAQAPIPNAQSSRNSGQNQNSNNSSNTPNSHQNKLSFFKGLKFVEENCVSDVLQVGFHLSGCVSLRSSSSSSSNSNSSIQNTSHNTRQSGQQSRSNFSINNFQLLSSSNNNSIVPYQNQDQVSSQNRSLQLNLQNLNFVYRSNSQANSNTDNNNNNITTSSNVSTKSHRVSVTFDRCKIVTVSCTCDSRDIFWCEHVVALVIFRIRFPHLVDLRVPISETLLQLDREQLQKLVQYLIAEHHAEVLPTAQRLADEIGQSQSILNQIQAAPDPTAGASVDDDHTWHLDEHQVCERIRSYLSSINSNSKDTGKHILALFDKVKEMLRARDSNGSRMLRLITLQFLNSVARNDKCRTLWDQLVSLWVVVVLNPHSLIHERRQTRQLLLEWSQLPKCPQEDVEYRTMHTQSHRWNIAVTNSLCLKKQREINVCSQMVHLNAQISKREIVVEKNKKLFELSSDSECLSEVTLSDEDYDSDYDSHSCPRSGSDCEINSDSEQFKASNPISERQIDLIKRDNHSPTPRRKNRHHDQDHGDGRARTRDTDHLMTKSRNDFGSQLFDSSTFMSMGMSSATAAAAAAAAAAAYNGTRNSIGTTATPFPAHMATHQPRSSFAHQHFSTVHNSSDPHVHLSGLLHNRSNSSSNSLSTSSISPVAAFASSASGSFEAAGSVSQSSSSPFLTPFISSTTDNNFKNLSHVNPQSQNQNHAHKRPSSSFFTNALAAASLNSHHRSSSNNRNSHSSISLSSEDSRVINVSQPISVTQNLSNSINQHSPFFSNLSNCNFSNSLHCNENFVNSSNQNQEPLNQNRISASSSRSSAIALPPAPTTRSPFSVASPHFLPPPSIPVSQASHRSSSSNHSGNSNTGRSHYERHEQLQHERNERNEHRQQERRHERERQERFEQRQFAAERIAVSAVQNHQNNRLNGNHNNGLNTNGAQQKSIFHRALEVSDLTWDDSHLELILENDGSYSFSSISNDYILNKKSNNVSINDENIHLFDYNGYPLWMECVPVSCARVEALKSHGYRRQSLRLAVAIVRTLLRQQDHWLKCGFKTFANEITKNRFPFAIKNKNYSSNGDKVIVNDENDCFMIENGEKNLNKKSKSSSCKVCLIRDHTICNDLAWIGHPFDPINSVIDTLLEASTKHHTSKQDNAGPTSCNLCKSPVRCVCMFNSNSDTESNNFGNSGESKYFHVPIAGSRTNDESYLTLAMQIALLALGQHRLLPLNGSAHEKAIRQEERLISRLQEIEMDPILFKILSKQSQFLLDGSPYFKQICCLVKSDLSSGMSTQNLSQNYRAPLHTFAHYLFETLLQFDTNLAYRIGVYALKIPLITYEDSMSDNADGLVPNGNVVHHGHVISNVQRLIDFSYLQSKQLKLAETMLSAARSDQSRLRTVYKASVRNIRNANNLHKLAQFAIKNSLSSSFSNISNSGLSSGTCVKFPLLLKTSYDLGLQVLKLTMSSSSHISGSTSKGKIRQQAIGHIVTCSTTLGYEFMMRVMCEWRQYLTPFEALSCVVTQIIKPEHIRSLRIDQHSDLARTARNLALECVDKDAPNCALTALELCESDTHSFTRAFNIVLNAGEKSKMDSSQLIKVAEYMEERNQIDLAYQVALVAVQNLQIPAGSLSGSLSVGTAGLSVSSNSNNVTNGSSMSESVSAPIQDIYKTCDLARKTGRFDLLIEKLTKNVQCAPVLAEIYKLYGPSYCKYSTNQAHSSHLLNHSTHAHSHVNNQSIALNSYLTANNDQPTDYRRRSPPNNGNGFSNVTIFNSNVIMNQNNKEQRLWEGLLEAAIVAYENTAYNRLGNISPRHYGEFIDFLDKARETFQLARSGGNERFANLILGIKRTYKTKKKLMERLKCRFQNVFSKHQLIDPNKF